MESSTDVQEELDPLGPPETLVAAPSRRRRKRRKRSSHKRPFKLVGAALGVLVVALGLWFAIAAARASGRDQRARAHLDKGHAFVDAGKLSEAALEFRSAVQEDPKFGEAYFALGDVYARLNDPLKAYDAYVRAADAMPRDLEVQLRAGVFLLAARKWTEAQDRANRALVLDPKNAAAQVLLGNALSGLQRFDEAIQDLQEAIDLDPSKAALYTNLGVVQTAHGREAEARDAFISALGEDPNNVDACLGLANIYWSQGELNQAEKYLKQALDVTPTHRLASIALAELYVVTKRVREAEAPLKAVADGSDQPLDLIRLADYYLTIGRVDHAKPWLDAAARLSRGAPLAAPRRAAIAFSERRPADAHAVLLEALMEEPRNVSVLLAEARLLSLEGKVSEALQRVNAAVAANPKSATAHYALATLHLARQATDDAVKEFSETIRLNQQATPARLQLSRLLFGRGDVAESAAYATDALKADPSNPIARLTAARSLAASGKFSEAEPRLASLASDYPKSAAVRSQIGVLKLMRSDVAGARADFEHALRLDGGFTEALAGLLSADLHERKYAEARARVETVLAKAPKDVPVLLLAAVVYKATGDAAACERSLKTVLQVDPSNIEAYTGLGQLYFSLKRLDDAKRQFGEASARQPKAVVPQTVIGMIQQVQGLTDAAKKTYEEVLQIDPNAAVAANNLAWLYVQSGEKLDTALKLAETAQRRNPQEAQFNDTLGWIYVKKDLPQAALPLLRQCIDRNPGNGLYRFHLGVAYSKAGDPINAKASLEAAVKLPLGAADAAEARKILAQWQ